MKGALFNLDGDLDIEALMEDIRQGDKERTWSTPGYSVAPISISSSGPIESSDALKAQADFNHFVATILRLILKHLEGVRGTMAALEQRQQGEAKEHTQASQQTKAQVDRLASWLGELEQWVDAIAEHSSNLEKEVSHRLDETEQHVQSRLAAIEERQREQVDRGAVAAQQTTEKSERPLAMVQDSSAQLDRLAARLSTMELKLDRDIDEMRMRVLRADRAIRALRHAAGAAELSELDRAPADPALHSQPPTQNLIAQSFDHFRFEHWFQADRGEIKRRQSVYLDLFRGKKNVLDLGCGRGEFLELLSEQGINVVGVDMDADMVDFCRDRGFTVVMADTFDYLSGLTDASLDGVLVAQVVEHLSPDEIVALIHLCAEKLKSGGVIVAETKNIHCPGVIVDFYLDPTHVRPVPAPLFQFMFEQAFFKIESVKFTSPVAGSGVPTVFDAVGGLPPEANYYRDYAIVAVKR